MIYQNKCWYLMLKHIFASCLCLLYVLWISMYYENSEGLDLILRKTSKVGHSEAMLPVSSEWNGNLKRLSQLDLRSKRKMPMVRWDEFLPQRLGFGPFEQWNWSFLRGHLVKFQDVVSANKTFNKLYRFYFALTLSLQLCAY